MSIFRTLYEQIPKIRIAAADIEGDQQQRLLRFHHPPGGRLSLVLLLGGEKRGGREGGTGAVAVADAASVGKGRRGCGRRRNVGKIREVEIRGVKIREVIGVMW